VHNKKKRGLHSLTRNAELGGFDFHSRTYGLSNMGSAAPERGNGNKGEEEAECSLNVRKTQL